MRDLFYRLIWRRRSSYEEYQLTKALHNTPQPIPPAGLKERLLNQASAVAREASLHPERLRRWLVWAIPAAITALAIVWIVGANLCYKHPVAVTRQKDQSITSLHAERIPPKQAIRMQPKKPVVASVQNDLFSASGPRAVKPGDSTRKMVHGLKKKLYLVVYTGAIHQIKGKHKAISFRVTVSRARKDTIGYAQAVAWGTDEEGNPVKTEWALVDKPSTNLSEEKLSITDVSGESHLLTCSVKASRANGI